MFSEPYFLAKPLDVWAYGICIFVYLKNKLPVSHNSQDFENQVVATDFAKLVETELKDFSWDLVQLVKACLAKEPAVRPTFAQILKHSWFEGRQEETLSTDIDWFKLN